MHSRPKWAVPKSASTRQRQVEQSEQSEQRCHGVIRRGYGLELNTSEARLTGTETDDRHRGAIVELDVWNTHLGRGRLTGRVESGSRRE